ncbi:hypothetical protein NDU88_001713 [Pleurodeles waltl]|uniref:Uncharacterized protein n=1 Tax=Pleurodeles waltl TaxID=8319 RepID=A0AAV7W0T1_PLEWA|nr:hypothetical protein NDU88_001713 [Pleurodeles waltl]
MRYYFYFLFLLVILVEPCGKALRTEPEEEYSVSTQEGADAILEEAGAHGRRDRQDGSEAVGVLNPVREGAAANSARAGGKQTTVNGTDRQVPEVENERRWRGAEAPTTTETAITEDALEGGDDTERPATFLEEHGPSRHRESDTKDKIIQIPKARAEESVSQEHYSSTYNPTDVPERDGRHDRHDGSEAVGVLKPMREGATVDSAGAGGKQTTANGMNRQVPEVENGRRDDVERRRRPLRKQQSQRMPWREEKTRKGQPHSRKNVAHLGMGYCLNGTGGGRIF